MTWAALLVLALKGNMTRTYTTGIGQDTGGYRSMLKGVFEEPKKETADLQIYITNTLVPTKGERDTGVLYSVHLRPCLS